METTHARSLVPVYPLVDPHDGDGGTTAFAQPDGTGRCADEHRGPSGEKVRLPDPFGPEPGASVLLKG